MHVKFYGIFFVRSLSALVILSVGFSLNAATLPSRMHSFSKSGETLDPGFEKWIKTNIEVTPVSEMNLEQILKWIEDKDSITKSLILLEGARKKKALIEEFSASKLKDKAKEPKDQQKELSPEAVSLIQSFEKMMAENIENLPNVIREELSKSAGSRHLLLAELYLAWSVLHHDSARKSGFAAEIFQDEPPATCAAKGLKIKSLTRENLAGISTEELLKTVADVNQYKSNSHRRRYLEAFAGNISEKNRSEVVLSLRAFNSEFPSLSKKFPWLQTEGEVIQQIAFNEAMRLVRKKNCADAEKIFANQLNKNISKELLTTVLEIGSDIERCFRAERRSSAQEFWARMAPKMEGKFGKDGALWVRVRYGYLKWISAELEEAAVEFKGILKEAEPAGDFQAIVAKSTYILGKIAEDGGDLDLAAKYYSDYISQFTDLEDFEYSLNSLVVNFAAKKRWAEMIPPLDRFLMRQSLVHIDKRPVGAMAFSLFWIGRAHLQLGQADLAREFWKRLAAEYYSTFYGALGHYVLEQTSGRNYAIEPSRVSGFDFAKFEKNLTEHSQKAAKRAMAFLQNGFPERAKCEIEEIVAASPNDYDTLLVKTLLLHASGAWLDAIKIYDAIPRSVRNGLPIGFERVLFPRKYAEMVKERSIKLNLDPDFVFALMRQESVFSKDAMSPVGATGLMQLMPSTARLELGKLSSDYVDTAERGELSEALAHEDSLRRPEINVTLGVHHLWRLMKIYKSPVYALTAYNASPAATQKWQRTLASDDWLTFIERIPYKETRAYVKLILRNYFYYKRWYNQPDGRNQVHIDSIVEELVKLSKASPDQYTSSLKSRP